MKILYDQQIFSFQDYGGISRYFYELIKGIKRANNNILIDGKISNNIYLSKLKKDTKQFLPGSNFPHKNVVMFYLNNIFDSNNLKEGNFDVLHATYYQSHFLHKLKGKPYVITVYDMTHELFTKESRGFVKKTLEYKRRTICNANKIIAISKNTKNDLISLYGIPANKIEVIYLGNPLEGVNPSNVESLPNKYLLFVGNRQGYKNFTFFVKAISTVLKEEKNLYLVCAGGGSFTGEERRLLLKLGIANQVRQIGFKSDDELAYIYKKALVYVLPSTYEGFGMTALEAFSMGCPVVASNTSSIPEVCGEAVIYINSKNDVSIRDGVIKVMNNENLRKNLIRLGFARVKKFTWEKTVKETLKIYERAINE